MQKLFSFPIPDCPYTMGFLKVIPSVIEWVWSSPVGVV